MHTTKYAGFIHEIKDKLSPDGFNKKLVTLKLPERQKCFVEFRSKEVLQKLSGLKEDDRVEIEATLEGKYSKAGQHYNNIVAITIKSVNN